MYMNPGKTTGSQKVMPRLKGLIEYRDSTKTGGSYAK